MYSPKASKMMVIVVLSLFIILTAAGCEEDTRPIVAGKNPPKITFKGDGTIVEIVVAGPYSKEYLKRSLKILNDRKNITTPDEEKELENIREKYMDKNYSIWYLKPLNENIRVSDISLIYGQVPDLLKQVEPKDVLPQRLKESYYYRVSAPTIGNRFHDTYFIIKNNNAIMVSEAELME